MTRFRQPWSARVLMLSGALAASGCSANLDVPENADISCGANADCPRGYRCAESRCVSLSKNQPPNLVIAAPARSIGIVDIPLTISDLEGDRVRLTAEADPGTGFRAITVTPSEIQATTQGISLTLQWDAALELGGTDYVADIVLRLSPEGGEPALSPPFAFGNDAPTTGLATIAGTKTGDVGVAFSLTDESSDLADVALAFAAGPLGPWYTANVSLGAVSSLTTSPLGVTHAVIWNSRAAPNSDPSKPQGIGWPALWETVYLRVQATDSIGGQVFSGTPGVVGPFAVDNTNNVPPSILLTTPAGVQGGSVLVTYVLFDAESDACDLVVEFRDSRGVFATATPGTGGDGTTALVSSPDGVAHTFAWDTIADDVALSAEDDAVQVRMSARGIMLGTFATGDLFSVDNQVANETPQLSVVDESGSSVIPSGVLSGDNVALPFLLADSESDPCDVLVEYQDEAGGWHAATGGPATGLTSSPAGALHSFVWHSLADGVGATRREVPLRLRALQVTPSRTGEWVTTMRGAGGDQPITVTIDNGPSLNEPPSVAFVDAGPAVVGGGLYDLYVMIRDAESNPVDLVDLAVTPDGAGWLVPALSGAHGGSVEGLASSPQGIVHVVTWDAGTDLQSLAPELLAFRARARDAYHDSPTVYFDAGHAPTVTGDVVQLDAAAPTSAGTSGPLLARNGILHAFWNTPAAGSPKTLNHAVSLDSGSTWSAPNPVSTTVADTVRNAAVVEAGTTLVAAYGTSATATPQLRVVRSTNGGTSWGSAISVTTAATEAGQPSMVVEGSTTAHLVWADVNRPSSRVYYSRSTNSGSSWSAGVPVSAAEDRDDLYPVVAVTGSTIHVAWAGGDTSAVVRYSSSVNNGVTWSVPADLAAMPSAGDLRLSAAPDGSLHLVGDRSNATFFYLRRSAAGVWDSSPRSLDSGATSAAAPVSIAADGRLSLAYCSADPRTGRSWMSALRSSDLGATWQGPDKLTDRCWSAAALDRTSGQYSFFLTGQPFGTPEWHPYAIALSHAGKTRELDGGAAPTLSRDSAGDLRALWTLSVGSLSGTAVFSRRRESWAMTGEAPLFGLNLPSSVHAVASGNNAWALMNATISITVPSYFYYALTSTNGGASWTGPSTTGARAGSLAADLSGNGYLLLVNQPSAGAGLALEVSTNGAAWSTPTLVSSLGASTGSPNLSWSGGKLRVAYLDTSGTYAVVRYSDSTTGATWSAPVNVSQNTTRSALAPVVAARPDGRLFLWWLENTGTALQPRLSSSTNDGVSWTGAQNAGTEPLCGTCSTLAFGVDPAGLLTAAWQTGTSTGTVTSAVSADNGATWGQMTRHGEGRSVRLATDVRGTYLIFAATDPETSQSLVRFLTKRSHHVLRASIPSPLAIPDNSAAGIVSSIVVDSGTTMSDVGIWLDVVHANAGQLTVRMTPPGGAPITVWQGGNARPWEGPIVFTSGGIAPATSIAALEGKSIVGTWQLQVIDSAAGTTGSLRDWGLRFR